MNAASAATWLLEREGRAARLTCLAGGYEQAVFAAGDVVVRVCGGHREPSGLAKAWRAAEVLAEREPDLVVAPLPASSTERC